MRASAEVDLADVGEARVEVDRAARHLLGAAVLALIVEQIGQIAVGLGVVGLERQGGVPALLRFRSEAEALEGVGQVVERLGVIRLERERALDAEPALVEFQHLLQNDAEIVPGRGKMGRERNSASSRLLTFRQQAPLAAHLGEVTEVDRRRARGSAGLAHVRDGEVEIAVGVGHEAEEVGRVGLAGPGRQHLPAGHLRFVGATRGPSGAGALDGLFDADWRSVWAWWVSHMLLKGARKR